jgi:hypothetical protein
VARFGVVVTGTHVRSSLFGLRGLDQSGVDTERGVSPLGKFAAVPWLATGGPVARGHVVAAAVHLDRGTGPQTNPQITVHGNDVVLRWSDGLDTRITLPTP